jgi:hypothetical protein
VLCELERPASAGLLFEGIGMRTIEVRRHTMRRKPGAHLSREGIVLARLVAGDSQPYNLVVTSTIPRAIETAIAMGYEVDQLSERLGQLPDEVTAEVDFPNPFSAVSEAVAGKGTAARFAKSVAGVWRRVVEQVPDGGRALIITHGLCPMWIMSRGARPSGTAKACAYTSTEAGNTERCCACQPNIGRSKTEATQ